MLRALAAHFIFCLSLFFAPLTTFAVQVATVPIGHLGNPSNPFDADMFTPGVQILGSLNYAYRIGTTEVTVGQYTEFLNSVASTDTYGLYNTSMSTDPHVAGIARAGLSGSYSYSVIGSPNKPITYVGWGDAARFSNWLHNGQPAGLQNASTTEDGAYFLNGATSNAALNAVSRNSGATWFIPTVNEWYKAAYYHPFAEGGNSFNYWGTAVRHFEVLSAAPPGDAAPLQPSTGNQFNDDGEANGYNDGFAVTGSTDLNDDQNYLTDVGSYTQSLSFFGTFDQSGNVYEWNEGLYTGTFRGVRGESWKYSASSLWGGFEPTSEFDMVGFRVATVPEPSSFVLAVIGLFGLVVWKRRTR